MEKIIPDRFITTQEAAAILVIAKFGGLPDRADVQALREKGSEVDDGGAIDEAVSEIWAAVEAGKLKAFVTNAKNPTPHELSTDIVTQIPGLRSPRGRDFRFLRNRNPHMRQFVEWYGQGFDTLDLKAVFWEDDVATLARVLLRRRRAATGKKTGRPSKKIEIKTLIGQAVDHNKWSATQSIKQLTTAVNRHTNAPHVSEDTVARALMELHEETCDRRFARLQRRRHRENDVPKGVLR